jgi:hypothetical protein
MGASSGFFAGIIPGIIKKKLDQKADAVKFAADAAVASNQKAIASNKAEAKSAADNLALAQKTAASQAAAQITAKKRARAGSRSVFTSPLGLAEQATTAKKTLLGQ